MSSATLLIISDSKRKKEDFSQAPFNLSPESFFLTGPESLNFIGLRNYQAIVIDSQALAPILKKISLGIRDDATSEALWQIFSEPSRCPVYLVVDRISAPTKEMRELGLNYILPKDVKTIDSSSNNKPRFGKGFQLKKQSILTADEVRELHQNGTKTLPPGQGLTSWAREVADSLGMLNAAATSFQYLYKIKAQTISELKGLREKLFEYSGKHSNLLFIVETPLIPVFNELFPSLRKKIVSPTIHWAKKGAFTGETALEMLTSLGCHGAIVPSVKPYIDRENLEALIKEAGKKGFVLYSTFTLAPKAGCDIIARNEVENRPLKPIYLNENFNPENAPNAGAVLVNDTFFKS